MDQLEAIFTKRNWNPVSFAVRCVTPVSLTTPAPASHVIAVDGNYGIEAHMLHGVRRVPLAEALHGATVVKRIKYDVPYAPEGLAWLQGTAERKAKYDWKGAFGLGLAPGRNWQEDTDWFCFELFANALAKAGRQIFVNNAHVNAQMLMAIRAAYRPIVA